MEMYLEWRFISNVLLFYTLHACKHGLLTCTLCRLHAQVAFGVKQRNPETLDAAVAATLELHGVVYLRATIASVTEIES